MSSIPNLNRTGFMDSIPGSKGHSHFHRVWTLCVLFFIAVIFLFPCGSSGHFRLCLVDDGWSGLVLRIRGVHGVFGVLYAVHGFVGTICHSNHFEPI